MRARFLGPCVALMLLAGAVGCNVKPPSEAIAKPKEGGAQRFVFPPQSIPFPAASVALDTRSGQLCKTYPWPDTKTLPSGLPLCTEATGPTVTSLTGADQYDPLGLFSKEEKAKRLLTKSQIQAVADKFGVTYQEALQDAKNQGYQVPM